MISTIPINFTSIQEVVDNYEYYKNIFLKEKVLVFRNANLSPLEHQELHDKLREKFIWHTKTTRSYTENHGRLINNENRKHKVGSDDIMLTWHVEHPYYSNPIVIATWNMHKFNTDSENGKTYFVDMEDLFARLSKENQEFIKSWTTEEDVSEQQGVKKENKVIGYHWINNNPVIRLSHLEDDDFYPKLKYINNRDPKISEYDKYVEIMKWIKNEVIYNEDIRIVHKWKQGDLLIPDMYKLCHAVTGGFSPEDREFDGLWGYQYKEDL
jgi:alpha-ketoglutarate-dependent taurine dioxygenase